MGAKRVTNDPSAAGLIARKGISYSPGGTAGDTGGGVEVRIEPGESLPADFPVAALEWLRECGAIERPAPPEETA